jgi:Uncharacterised protein conserved in bacteria (DUF2336)
MSPILRLMHDLEESIVASPERREMTLWGVTDLFLLDAARLTDDQIDIFDSVIARLAAEIETRARAELARRLAPVPNAPAGIIHSLAHDEIDVARPVLVHSPRLDDETLVTIVMAKGEEHQQAVAQRPQLTATVTDALVSRGGRPVVHALAANRGARFSRNGAAVLVDKARLDEELQLLLQARNDLPAEQVRRLIELAQDTARQHLAATMPSELRHVIDEAVEQSAKRVRAIVAGSLDYSTALDTVGAIEISRRLDEEDIAGFATNDCLEETICALASCVELSLSAAERLFTMADSDLLLVVGKAQGWSWTTIQLLLRLRDPDTLLPHNAKRLAETYEDLAPKTAEGVLRFLRQRERAETSAQSRPKVR